MLSNSDSTCRGRSNAAPSLSPTLRSPSLRSPSLRSALPDFEPGPVIRLCTFTWEPPTCISGFPYPLGRTGPESHLCRWAESRSEEHTSELQSRGHLVCRLLLEKKKQKK